MEKKDRLSFHFFHVDKEGLDWKQVITNVRLPVFKSSRRKALKADGVVNGATMFTARKYFVKDHFTSNFIFQKTRLIYTRTFLSRRPLQKFQVMTPTNCGQHMSRKHMLNYMVVTKRLMVEMGSKPWLT